VEITFPLEVIDGPSVAASILYRILVGKHVEIKKRREVVMLY
jgi:hypothetical protein